MNDLLINYDFMFQTKISGTANWFLMWALTNLRILFLRQTIEAVVQRCSIKKMFIEISQNSQKTSVPESPF